MLVVVALTGSPKPTTLPASSLGAQVDQGQIIGGLTRVATWYGTARMNAVAEMVTASKRAETPVRPVRAKADNGASAVSAPSSDSFLACTRGHESDTAGGYRAVSPDGVYRGAYQFARSTWDNVARHAGRPDLVGVDPAMASAGDQDALALDLYHWQGAAPWGGRCGGES